MHFIEQLVDAFEKSPRKSNLNYKTLSFLIRQLKNHTGFLSARNLSNPENLIHLSSIHGRQLETTVKNKYQ
jgi:hypothetical protein